MTRLIDRLDWRACMTIIREEAGKAGVDPEAVVMACRPTGPVRTALNASIRRIMDQTKCSMAGLSSVWGVGVPAIKAAIWEGRERPKREQKGGTPPAPDPELERLRQRLRWAHGDAKAHQILSGQDPKTQRDLAAWKALGTGRAAA